MIFCTRFLNTPNFIIKMMIFLDKPVYAILLSSNDESQITSVETLKEAYRYLLANKYTECDHLVEQSHGSLFASG